MFYAYVFNLEDDLKRNSNLHFETKLPNWTKEMLWQFRISINHWVTWQFPSKVFLKIGAFWFLSWENMSEMWGFMFSWGFHIRESGKPERSSFLSKGNLSETCGLHKVSHMFTLGNLRFPVGFSYVYLGKPELRFPSCFPLEFWGFHVVFILFALENPLFLIVSIKFPLNDLGFQVFFPD